MGAVYDDLEGHEGYAARRLGDGTVSATWAPSFRAYVAACACGWTGGDHPPTEDGYDAAVDEWDERHGRPLLAEAVPADVREAVLDAQRAVSELLEKRPSAGLKALQGLARWAQATVVRTRAASSEATRRDVPEATRRRLPGGSCRL